MYSNPLFNVVHRLRQIGCDPHRVGPDVWEAHCPACRAQGRTLVLTRASPVACGSGKGCYEERILAAMGLGRGQAYDPTPRTVSEEISAMPIDEPREPAAHLASAAPAESREPCPDPAEHAPGLRPVADADIPRPAELSAGETPAPQPQSGLSAGEMPAPQPQSTGNGADAELPVAAQSCEPGRNDVIGGTGAPAGAVDRETSRCT